MSALVPTPRVSGTVKVQVAIPRGLNLDYRGGGVTALLKPDGTPSTGVMEAEGPWGSLTAQSRLLGELQGNKKSCLIGSGNRRDCYINLMTQVRVPGFPLIPFKLR